MDTINRWAERLVESSFMPIVSSILALLLSACQTAPRSGEQIDEGVSPDAGMPPDLSKPLPPPPPIEGPFLIYAGDFKSDPCPGDWQQDRLRGACTRQMTKGGNRVARFSTGGRAYTEIVGTLCAKMMVTNDAFGDSDRGPNPPVQPDFPYADGIAFFSGARHLWTFAHGNTGFIPNHNCPQAGGSAPPTDVDSNYYCVTAPLSYAWTNSYTDAEFHVVLPTPTTEDVIVSIMGDQDSSDEDVGICKVKIWGYNTQQPPG